MNTTLRAIDGTSSTARSFFHPLLGAGRLIATHKVMSAIALLAIIGGGWFAYHALVPKSSAMLYTLGTVSTGTIVSSVSESGQISTTNTIDIKPQVSGTITWVGVKAGDTVRAGQALMSIDSLSARQSISDAEKSLAAAQLQYQKDSAQAPISYQNDVNSLAAAKQSLQDDYNTAYNDISNTYLDLPSVVVGLQDTLFGYDFDAKKSLWNMDYLTNLFIAVANTGNLLPFRDQSKSAYASANGEYTTALTQYQHLTRTSSTDAVDAMLTATIALMTDVAQGLQDELNFLGVASDLAQTYTITLPSSFTTVQNNTRTYLATTNSDLSTLLAEKKTLDAAKQAIVTAGQNITLDQVGNSTGESPISLQISKNSLDKQAADIASQKADLAKYTVVAPFSGTLAAVNLNVGDSASGSSAATIISKSQVAQLSLNEVDVAKIALGDKATLTFDAIPDLTLTGKVIQVDSIGTVSQGVVSYTVKIGLDSQDARVKPGMTVNAAIQTGTAQNVLIIPSAAVKTSNGTSYVLLFDPAIDTSVTGTVNVASPVAPSQVTVTTGLSDDTNVEIRSGLTDGEQVVTRATTAAAASKTTASASAGGATRGAAAGGFSGGNARAIGL
jgi:HlyD family secretion protein